MLVVVVGYILRNCSVNVRTNKQLYFTKVFVLRVFTLSLQRLQDKPKKYKKDKPTLTTFWNNLFSVYGYDANVGRELYFERKPLVFC